MAFIVLPTSIIYISIYIFFFLQNHNIDNKNNILNFKNNLEKTDWSFIKSNDLKYSMELFLNYFNKLYDKSCSEIIHLQNIRIKSQLPWFIKNIKNACKENKNYILNSLMTKVLKILFDTKNIKISLLV